MCFEISFVPKLRRASCQINRLIAQISTMRPSSIAVFSAFLVVVTISGALSEPQDESENIPSNAKASYSDEVDIASIESQPHKRQVLLNGLYHPYSYMRMGYPMAYSMGLYRMRREANGGGWGRGGGGWGHGGGGWGHGGGGWGHGGGGWGHGGRGSHSGGRGHWGRKRRDLSSEIVSTTNAPANEQTTDEVEASTDSNRSKRQMMMMDPFYMRMMHPHNNPYYF